MLLGPHGSYLEHDGAAQLPLGTRVWYPGVREDGSILFVRSRQGQRATKPKISTDITDRMCGFHLYLPWRGLPPAWAWLSPWAKPNFPVNMCIMGYTSTTPKSSLTSMAGILFQINF